MSDPSVLDYGAMITGMGGGLALFLYGMRKLTESLKVLAGARMKSVLARMTTNRFSGLAAGAAVTAVIQSSSVTTVLVVGFISAGLLTFTQSIGVIMGANIGTTVTAQIVAFKVTQYALLLIAAGFLAETLARSPRVRQAGITCMGLGLLFFGMELMSSTMSPLRSWPPFMELIQTVRNPAFGIFLGFAFTALVQSSSATTGVVIVLAAEGLLTLETGIAIAFGANIGTCVTALLSTLGRPREALRAAAVHVIFNVAGVALWVAFIPEFAALIRALSPVHPELSGIARSAAEAPRQIANAHTLFNVANALVLVWFARPIERLVNRLLPGREAAVARDTPKYLDPMYLDQPALALDRVRLEIGRLAARVNTTVRSSLQVVTRGDARAVEHLRDSDDAIDHLHQAVVAYLGRISSGDLIDPLPARLQHELTVANYLENIADVVATDLAGEAAQREARNLVLTAAQRESLGKLHAATCEVLEEALQAFADDDPNRAMEARERKDAVNALADAARAESAKTLASGRNEALEAYRITNDVIECYTRIHALARRIARAVTLAGRSEPGPGRETQTDPGN